MLRDRLHVSSLLDGCCDTVSIHDDKPRLRFVLGARTGGLAPLFRAIDAANAPTLDGSRPEARTSADRQILSRGVIRIGRPAPPTAEFELVSADDPTGFSTA